MGTAKIFQQYDRAHMEQTAQASRMTSAMADADNKVDNLEGVLRASLLKTEEYSHLGSASASSVYVLKGEALKFQGMVFVQAEEMTHGIYGLRDLQ